MKLRLKKQKTNCLMALLILVTMVFLCLPVKALANEINEDNIDFVLLLDCSGSMGSSDTQGLYISAAKMFVDMLPTENARLSVIGFGPNYGGEAYNIKTVDQESGTSRMVKVFYGLESITDQDNKEIAKTAIDDAAASIVGTTYTPIGYALQAAEDVLVSGGAERDSAAIILMSDGRVTGQQDSYNEAYDYTSIDDAIQVSNENEWPIYCLELNEDEGNDGNGWQGKVGKYQMRENIPLKTGTDPIELRQASQAENAFASIFAKFFDATPTIAEETINNGMASMTFEIGEMVAETNMTLTGAIDQVEKVELLGPDGIREEYSQSDSAASNRVVIFEDRYITMKLMTPTNGNWTVNVYGTDGVQIGLYAVSIREMNLELSDNDPYMEEGILPKGATVEFSARYIYHGNPYSSPTVYREIPAKLIIEGSDGRSQVFDMEGRDDCYTYTFTFPDSGTFSIRTVVQSELFRTGDKESGSLVYTVGNLPVTAKGTVPAQEIGVRGNIELESAVYFNNPDDDPLIYGVIVDDSNDPVDGIQAEIDENSGTLSINAGKNAGTVSVTVTAKDSQMSVPAEQSFAVSVLNQPIAFTIEAKADAGAEQIEKTVNLVLKQNRAPEFLMKAADVTGKPDYELIFADYFMDPDDPEGNDVKVVCDTSVDNDPGIVIEEVDEKHIRIEAQEKGSSTFTIIASDANDPAVQKSIVLRVNSVNAWSMIVGRFWLPAVIVLAVLIFLLILLLLLYGKRSIYGVWDISTNTGENVSSKSFARAKAGQKPKAKLTDLLRAVGINNINLGDVEMTVGNNRNQKVFVRNLQKLSSVAVGSKTYDHQALKKVKKLEIPKGRSIVLEKDGIRVNLDRQRKA